MNRHETTSANLDEVRALVAEHVPDDLRDALSAWATKREDGRKAREVAMTNCRLADALETVEKSLNAASAEMSPDELTDLIASATLSKATSAIGRTAAELVQTVPAEPAWIVPNVIARGWTVKIAAREKTGKGTLIFNTLGRLESGAATVFGAATQPVTSVIYTEEPEDSVREKVAAARLERALIVYGWEVVALDWRDKVDLLVRLASEGGHGVLFIDNVSRAAGVEDEAGVELARAAEYLSDRARSGGLSTFLDHHHKKGAGRLDDKSRGGTALAGACENNIEMERIGGWDSRVRRLSSRGRLSSTIWTRTIALSDDGTRYESVADNEQPQNTEDRRRLRVLGDVGDAGVTAPEFARAIDKSEDTARRALSDFVVRGWAREEGTRPVRYFSTVEGTGPLDF